ncbi:MAG: ATP-binding cassette, subfamily er 3, partial [Gaiellaceae bacterium]|nr:ATP-binding cassette, subfamily er 3 [Gaiellaceae bacterium]
DRALLDAVAERTLAIEDGTLHAYEGGWAEMLRRRDERDRKVTASEAKPPPEPKAKRKPSRPRAPRPSELERVESEIAARESEVRELEAKLAEDWSNVETLAAHKSSRDALQSLLERWEQLFAQAQS